MYLDPGTGSFVVQAVLAALLGLGVFIKMFWGKITSLLSKKEDHSNEEDEV